MNAVPFDTVKLANQLEAGGFSPDQACAMVVTLADVVVDANRAGADSATEADLAAAVKDLRADLQSVEQRMTIRFGGMLVTVVGVLLVAIRYLPPHP